jgi:hypothetical protein
MSERISTEELHLAYRVLAVLAADNPTAYVPRLIFEAAADLVRVEYRNRTMHDPLPGQTTLDGLLADQTLRPTA